MDKEPIHAEGVVTIKETRLTEILNTKLIEVEHLPDKVLILNEFPYINNTFNLIIYLPGK